MEIVSVFSYVLIIIALLGITATMGLAIYAALRAFRERTAEADGVEYEMTRSDFDRFIASLEAAARVPLQQQIANLQQTLQTQQAELTRLREQQNPNT